MSEKILDIVKPGVLAGEDVKKVFEIAKKNLFALPAVNIVNSDSANGVMEAAVLSRSVRRGAAIFNSNRRTTCMCCPSSGVPALRLTMRECSPPTKSTSGWRSPPRRRRRRQRGVGRDRTAHGQRAQAELDQGEARGSGAGQPSYRR